MMKMLKLSARQVFHFLIKNKHSLSESASTIKFINLKMESNAMSAVNFRPLHDRVLVKRLDAEEKTKGGIIIPETAKEKPIEGQVIAIGAGTVTEDGKRNPLDVKVGDVIVFGKWSGTECKIDGEEYLIMKESDILGIKLS